MGADDLVIKVVRSSARRPKLPEADLDQDGAGRVRDDIKIAYKDGFDFVQPRGLQGSTGATDLKC